MDAREIASGLSADEAAAVKSDQPWNAVPPHLAHLYERKRYDDAFVFRPYSSWPDRMVFVKNDLGLAVAKLLEE